MAGACCLDQQPQSASHTHSGGLMLEFVDAGRRRQLSGWHALSDRRMRCERSGPLEAPGVVWNRCLGTRLGLSLHPDLGANATTHDELAEILKPLLHLGGRFLRGRRPVRSH
jgi:hypothetical protein